MPYALSRPSFAPALANTRRSQVHQRAAQLISRYPDLGRPQLDELVAIFPRLSAMDVALMLGDQKLAPRLDAFCAANGHLVSPSLADYAVVGAIMSLPFLVLLVLMIAS